LGLGRPELFAWALYDCGNSAFVTTMVAAVFPVYFAKVLAKDLPDASQRYATASAIALTVIALLSPLLGAIADRARLKKKLLAVSVALGAGATAGLALMGPGDWLWALVLFGLGNVGLTAGFTFYDALLPHIATNDEMDRVSSAGYAMGYLGGALLLGLNLLVIQKPEWFGLPNTTLPVQLCFVSVAIWWVAFSLPLFRKVPEPPGAGASEARAAGALHVIVSSARELGKTLSELRRYRNAFLMLLANLLYSDGINTIIRMATLYGAEIGIDQGAMIGALLLTQVVGVPFAFLFGSLGARFGAKRAIFVALVAYMGVSILGYRMQTATHFFILAGLVGMVQGGSQALSRSLFASMIPRSRSSEFFGFYGVVEKVTGILGPAVFAIVLRITGSSRDAVLVVISFFILGALFLWFVDVDEGRRAAAAAEAEGTLHGDIAGA
jgi:UMF1 family MFS transporter